MQNGWLLDEDENVYYQVRPYNGAYWRVYYANSRPAKIHTIPRHEMQQNTNFQQLLNQPVQAQFLPPVNPNYQYAAGQQSLTGGSTTYKVVSDQITNITGAGTGHWHEQLDRSYKVRSDAAQFFCVGRVFQVLWSQPAGPGTRTDVTFTINQFGENVFSKVTRFVVVRQSHDSCTAIQINTYRGQGLAKQGIRKADHGIIYTGAIEPRLAPDEESSLNSSDRTTADPIQIIPNSAFDRLDAKSRINFRKVFNVEYNVKVKDYGMVRPDHIEGRLVGQFRDIFFR